ncbi:hypothetical protein PHMEG_00017582, partial [Phytophthora megakarya]
ISLHSSRSGFKFLITMIGIPFFSSNLCGGIPLITSCYKKFLSMSSSIASFKRYSRVSVGMGSVTAAFIR